MKPQCKQAIEAHLSTVAGKPVKLTDAQVKRMDSRFHEGAKVLARRDRATWQNLSPEQRTVEIGKWVREQEQIAADAAAVRKTRQLAAIIAGARKVDDFAAAHGNAQGAHGKGVIDFLEGVDNTVRGAEQVAMQGFGKLLKDTGVDDIVDFANRKSDKFFADVVREIYEVNTGNAQAKAFAAKWSGTKDGYREARNRAGGTVGKLEHYAPQTHNPTIMQRAGYKDRWLGFMVKNVDRSQYMDDAGKQLDDVQLRELAGKWYDTIVQDGGNKVKTDVNGIAEGSSTGGGGANLAAAQNDKHREIHFSNAESVIEYNKQFNDRTLGATFFDSLLRDAGDVARIQQLGPNPELTYATLRDTARVRDGERTGAAFKNGEVKGASRAGLNSDAYYRSVMGNVEYASLDQISSALTAYQAATKLTSTALRAPFQDTPGVLLNAADVGQFKNLGTIVATAFNPKEAARFGIGAEVAVQAARRGADRIISQGRFNVGNAISRYAQSTMRLTLLDAWTNAVRRAGQTSHALALGEWSKTPWAKLDDSQRGLLNNAGILEGDWQHIQNVPRSQLRGHDIHDVSDVAQLGLDPDVTGDLQSKMMGFIRMGGDITTSEHNLTAKTLMSMGGRSNALTKQTMLFKNAGAVQTAHMIDRLGRKNNTTKAGYIAATMASGVGIGYLALVAQAAAAGQNPPPLNDWRTIGKAMAVTGGFAMVQDLIQSAYNAVSGNDSGHSSSAVPIFGDMATIGKIALKAANGETSEAGYMGIKFARQQVAPLNYWYAKMIVDHMFFNDAAEGLNPGYQKRLNRYADQKGQQYFWKPNGDFETPQIGHYTKPMGD